MRAMALVTVVAAAFGCAGSAGEVGGGDAMGAEDVAATVEVKLQQDEVRFLLHVTNTSDRSLEFVFPSSQRYDFQVYDESGETVWTWSADKSFLQAISEVTLAPGETWNFEAAWDSGNRTGRYQVVGMVTTREHEVRQSATFDLP